MDNIDKYIDKLFEQKFSEKAFKPGIETSLSEKNWAQMQKALKKKAFLKFSLANFNIYYLSVALSAIIITGSMLLTENHEIKAEAQTEISAIEKETPENNVLIIDTLENELPPDTISCMEVKAKKNEVAITSSINKQKISETGIEEVTREEIEPLIPRNHCINKEIDNNQNIIDTLKPPISSSDTIFMVDTVKVTKKKLILQKKN